MALVMILHHGWFGSECESMHIAECHSHMYGDSIVTELAGVFHVEKFLLRI